MTTINPDDLRRKVEEKYLRQRQALEGELAKLEQWKQEKIAFLDVLAGKRPIDEWLDLPLADGLDKPKALPAEAKPARSASKREMTVNQAQVVRDAVEGIEGEISNKSIKNWIATNKPHVAERVNTRSIRTELWRLSTKDNKLTKIREEEGQAIYIKKEEGHSKLHENDFLSL